MSCPHLTSLLISLAIVASSSAFPCTTNRCECVGTSIDCHGKRLQQLPMEIPNPSQIQEFNFSHNNFQNLPADLFRDRYIVNLIFLDFSFNQIVSVDGEAFADLTRLELLKLDHNRIRTLPADTFFDSSALRVLLLNNSQIEWLPPTIFDNLAQLQHLDLTNNQFSTLPEDIFDANSFVDVHLGGYNPWHCNCSLIKIRTKTNLSIANQLPTCSSPLALAGQSWSQLSDEQLCGLSTGNGSTLLTTVTSTRVSDPEEVESESNYSLFIWIAILFFSVVVLAIVAVVTYVMYSNAEKNMCQGQ